jgi:hypothetical protein
MRSFSLRLSVLVAMILGGISSSVWALGNRGVVETVYLDPLPATAVFPTTYETTSWVLPTSYEPTAWVTPTSYFLPTSATYSTVYPTSYVADSVMVAPTAYALETTYYRRGLFGRRWRVGRPVVTAYSSGYLPTAYYLPTTSRTLAYSPTVLRDPGLMRTAYVNPADCPCPVTTSQSAAVTRAAAPSSGPRSVRSESAEEMPVTSSNVPPAPAENEAPAARSAAQETRRNTGILENPRSLQDNTPTPPAAPKPALNPTGAAANPVKPATPKDASKAQPVMPLQPADDNFAPPPAPAGDPSDVQPAPIKPDAVRRDSQRPTYSATPRLTSLSARSVLYGMVESGSAGEPEEGVRVMLASASDSTPNRVTMTNAFGKFAIRVPDGQWDVMVTMPSGRQRLVDGPLGRITVRNGQITDQEGHAVPSVIISR